MYTNAVEISELIPETFVKVILSNGQHKYGFILASAAAEDRTVLVTGGHSRSSRTDVEFEEIKNKQS